MKITTPIRALLVILSLIMVFSLFACGEEQTTVTDTQGTDAPTEAPEETNEATEAPTQEATDGETTATETDAPECEHEVEVVTGKAATCTEAGLTDGEVCSKCKAVLKEQTVIEALGHDWDNGTVADGVVCGQTADVTYKCKRAGCTETRVEAGTTVQHDFKETARVDADCTTAGSVSYKCDRAGCTETKTETINALGHTEETVTGKAATCTEKGLTDGKKCSVCDVTILEQTEIEATGHTYKDVAYIAATTKEAGFKAHKGCENCDMAWDKDTDAEITDGSHIIPVFVPTTNYYFGYEELKGKNTSISTVTPGADRTYVRWDRSKEGSDGYITLSVDATKDAGKYLIIKYRTNNETSIAAWAKTTSPAFGSNNGGDSFTISTTNDGNWHLAIYDIDDKLPAVDKDAEGKYLLNDLRFDILDAKRAEGYFEIAYVALANDFTQFVGIMQDGDLALCPHIEAKNPEYTNKGETHTSACVICQAAIESAHTYATAVWSVENKCYKLTCPCGAEVDGGTMIYKADPTTKSAKSFTPEQKDGYVRYTNSGKEDPFIHLYTSGRQLTGKYVVVKYRVSKEGLSYHNSFVGSAMGTHKDTAIGACCGNSGAGKTGSFKLDGENWQYLVIEAKSQCFVANADGSYTLAFIRLGLSGFAIGDYIDVAELAFADNRYAADRYVLGDAATCDHADAKYAWSNEEATMVAICVCGEKLTKDCPHADLNYVWNEEKQSMVAICSCGKEFTKECDHPGATYAWSSDEKLYVAAEICSVCGTKPTKDMVYKTEGVTSASKVGAAGGENPFLTAEVIDGVVRYTPNKSADDPYFYPVRGNTNVTGQYLVIKYRVVNNGKNLTTGKFFASSAASTRNTAAGNNGDNKNSSLNGTTLYGDGNWHYLVVTPGTADATNDTFTPNADGTYSWMYLRMNLSGFDAYNGSCYFEIDEVAFADNIEAVENYAFKNETKPAYRWTIDNNADNGNTGLNGTAATLPFDANGDENKAGVADMKDAGEINATKGIAVGGWFVTPGGTASYKYRVVSVDGEVVKNPELIDGWTGVSNSNITAMGTGKGWSADCGKGSAWQSQNWLDLTGYEGKKVDVEIVAVTNYGQEVTFLKINNINVKAA